MAFRGSYNRTSAESTIMSNTSKRYLDPGAMGAFMGDTQPNGGVGSLLGETKGNVAQRQGIQIGKDGQPRRTSATDAILYQQSNVAGRFGFRSGNMNRYRNMNKSLGWRGRLKQSTGSNKAPHGVAQSSLDSTKESYSTWETRFGKSGYDSNEKWNAQTKKFERQWSGFDKLDIKQRGQHYAQSKARMFRTTNKNKNVGRHRIL